MLNPDIEKNIQKQAELKGIEVFKLNPGSTIEVETQNSTYYLEIVSEKGDVIVEGGTAFPKRTKAKFIGSNFGGSMLKTGWIGYDMRMEICTDEKLLVTSRVKTATVYGEGWQYSMDWPQDHPAVDPQ